MTSSDGAVSTFTAQATRFEPSATGASTAYYQFQADIAGLKAGTSYRYQVSMGGQILAADPVFNSFATPASGDFSFLVIGDSGTSSPEQTAILERMLAEPNISSLIHVGDIAYDSGTFPQFEQSYFQKYAPLMSRTPFFTAPGNHEYLTDSATPYLAVHIAPASNVPAADVGRYYSYDRGDAHFVSLDSNILGTDAGTRMLAWLDADLAGTTRYWKIVFLHHPPYPTGTHMGDPLSILVHSQVNPIVEAHGVQLVLSGHEHGYERSFPLVNDRTASAGTPSTVYLISGGGGAGLATVGRLPQTSLALAVHNYLRVDVKASQLTVTATGQDGSVLDRVTLAPPPAISPGGIVNVGDFSSNIAPGSLVAAFGRNFAIRHTVFGGAFPLPDHLAGISVTANGIPAPIVFASPGQVNFQMPFGLAGQVAVQITTANGSASYTANVTPVAPSVLAVVANDSAVSSANPAPPGGWVVIYATGLGAPASSFLTGQAPTGAIAVTAPIQVLLNNVALAPAYAGLAPGFAGLNQINVQLPANLRAGSYSLQIASGSVRSPAVTVAVGSAGTQRERRRAAAA